MVGWGGDSRSQLRIADTLCHDIFAGILGLCSFVLLSLSFGIFQHELKEHGLPQKQQQQ